MVTGVPDPTPEIILQLLTLTTRQGGSVRSYLADLLRGLWLGEVGGKYGMTGESDWRWDIYAPMQEAGLIPKMLDGYGLSCRADGSRHPEDQRRADDLICAAIGHLMGEPR